MKNVLFIVTDDQRFNTIHALGNKQIKTPNLDRLVTLGTSFTNAHIPGGSCGAVCMPSRAMIHTGRSLFHLDGMGQIIPQDHVTMAENFKNNGYKTIGIGKWHNSPAAFARGFTDGESIFFGGMWDHWNVPLSYYDPSGEYDNKIDFVTDFYNSNKTEKVNCDHFIPGKHSSELLTDSAISQIHKNKDNPFFLYLAYLAPHDPRTMPEKFKQMYSPDDIELPANFSENQLIEHFPLMQFRDESLAEYPRNPKEIKRHIAEYYGMISHLDNEFGRILDALTESGHDKDTIIVFTSDNGLSIGQHGLMGKEDLYDHGIRIPLIIAGADIPQNQKRSQFVYLFDIYPTLCDLIGISIPDSVDGMSFSELFTNSEKVHRDELYLAFAEYIRGVKNKDFKMLEYAVSGHSGQLFDLKNDPQETHNLYYLEEYEDIRHHLKERIVALRDEWDDMDHEIGAKYWSDALKEQLS